MPPRGVLLDHQQKNARKCGRDDIDRRLTVHFSTERTNQSKNCLLLFVIKKSDIK
jgi:hypothetical protein